MPCVRVHLSPCSLDAHESSEGAPSHVLPCQAPELRPGWLQDRMHLDCVFSILGDDCCLMMEEMMGEDSPTKRLVDEWTRDDATRRLQPHSPKRGVQRVHARRGLLHRPHQGRAPAGQPCCAPDHAQSVSSVPQMTCSLGWIPAGTFSLSVDHTDNASADKPGTVILHIF